MWLPFMNSDQNHAIELQVCYSVFPKLAKPAGYVNVSAAQDGLSLLVSGRDSVTGKIH